MNSDRTNRCRIRSFLEIRDFSHRTQQQIFDDILDQQVQQGRDPSRIDISQ